MSDRLQRSDIVSFGPFKVDFRSEELLRKGFPVRLPAQSFQVLRMLLDRPGELVSRQDLQKALWPGESFGDFEHGLNAAVNRLRDALGDSAEDPKFVETLPRRGYRFIPALDRAEVRERMGPGASPFQAEGTPECFESPIAEQTNAATVAEQTSPGTGHAPERPKRQAQVVWVTLLLVFCAGAVLYFSMVRRGEKTSVGPGLSSRLSNDGIHVTPLTSLPGMEYAPSFSPDGSQVAFAWDGGVSDAPSPYDLYTKVIGSERMQRLTHRPAAWIAPAWSRDGGDIAFARSGAGATGVFMVSALGGPERKLADATFRYTWPMSLSWSRDGRMLLYATDEGIQALEPEDGEVHHVNTPSNCAVPTTPSFSPDGQWIAFSCFLDSSYELEVLPAKGGSARELVRVNEIPLPLAWSTDSERIIYSDHRELFEIDREGGRPRLLPFAHDALQPAVSFRGERLVYAEWIKNVNLWRLDLQPSSRGSTRLMVKTSRVQRAANISPDGKRMVFEAERSGSNEVWVSNLDGSEAVQLSHFHSLTGTARWSPDGQTILFDSRESGVAALYLVDPQTAVPRRIPIHGLPASVPSWSRDGRWIYFRAGMNEQGGLYRVSPQGGDPQLVTPTRGYNVQEAKTGGLIYFMSGDANSAISVLNAVTGSEGPLKGMPTVDAPTDWVVSSKGIFFVDRSTPKAHIGFFDFASARVTRSMVLPKPPEVWGGLALSPDESWLAYAQLDRSESDLMLAEGFR